MRFDWYAATVKESPSFLVEALLFDLSKGGDVQQLRGIHGYSQRFLIRNPKRETVATVLAGGNSGAPPNCFASGEDTEPFVASVRSRWPEHNVTRFDAAQDFAEKGSYEALEAVCREVATQAGVKGRTIVPDDLQDGRTYYLGATSSDVQARLYEKGKELRMKMPLIHQSLNFSGLEDLVRLEIQVRPKKEWRAAAAVFEPSVVWGFAAWSAQLAERVFKLQVPRISMRAGRESDDERAWRFMLMQYGKVISRMANDLGSWECLGLQLRDDIKKFKR